RAMSGSFFRTKLNTNLVIGAVILLIIVLFAVLGPLFVNPKNARVGAVRPNRPPSAQNVFGTDAQGRDVLTTLVIAVPATLQVGLVGGGVSTALGMVLGLTAGFFAGGFDWVVRTFSDVLMAVPIVSFLILLVARM